MIVKNFITSLKRFSVASALNIVGMAVAFATAYLILVQLCYDFTFNRGIANADRIFVIEKESNYEPGKYHPFLSRPISETFCKDNPYIEAYGLMPSNVLEAVLTLKRGEAYEKVKVNYTWATTFQGLEVLGVYPVRGSLKDLDGSILNIAMTESAAKRVGLDVGDDFCFGNEWKPDDVAHVIAVIPDFPENSDWRHVEMIYDFGDQFIDNRSESSFPYFIRLRSAEDARQCLGVGKTALCNYFASDLPVGDTTVRSELEKVIDGFRITPITKTHFDSSSNFGVKGNRSTAFALLAIAILVLVIAFINFVNFFLAMVPRRLHGVNTYRVYGCSLLQIRLNILFELFGLVLVALLLGVLILVSLRSSFITDLVSASIRLKDNLGLAFSLSGISLLSILLVGVYPAYYITSFPLALTSKGSFVSTRSGQRLRMALVGVQFFISITLIICAVFIKMQHEYMMRYDMGFNKSHLLCGEVPTKVVESFEDREAFAAELKKNPQIVDVAYASGSLVASGRMSWGRSFKDEDIYFECYPVSYNFLDFMGIEISEGRTFSKSDERDTCGVFVFNEYAKNEFGLSLEDKIYGHVVPTKIAGFCKDFKYRPLQYENLSFAFYVFGPKAWKRLDNLYVRTAPNADIPQVIDYIKDVTVRFSPAFSRDYLHFDFFDKELGLNYKKESDLSLLISLFSLVSIIISLMGVFGLVLFETQYRRKEIGIRRVFGSSFREILIMFNLRFLRVVFGCFVLAVPVSYVIVDHWLNGFAYRTPIWWWVFAMALLVVSFITVATVTLRSWRAAAANPVDAIKNE